jgi:hypothetical protein
LRVRRLSPSEIAALPPVRTKSIEFTGSEPGRLGVWEQGDPVGPAPRDDESLLDWALVSWARRRRLEEVWDFTGARDDDGQA